MIIKKKKFVKNLGLRILFFLATILKVQKDENLIKCLFCFIKLHIKKEVLFSIFKYIFVHENNYV